MSTSTARPATRSEAAPGSISSRTTCGTRGVSSSDAVGGGAEVRPGRRRRGPSRSRSKAATSGSGRSSPQSRRSGAGSGPARSASATSRSCTCGSAGSAVTRVSTGWSSRSTRTGAAPAPTCTRSRRCSSTTSAASTAACRACTVTCQPWRRCQESTTSAPVDQAGVHGAGRAHVVAVREPAAALHPGGVDVHRHPPGRRPARVRGAHQAAYVDRGGEARAAVVLEDPPGEPVGLGALLLHRGYVDPLGVRPRRAAGRAGWWSRRSARAAGAARRRRRAG